MSDEPKEPPYHVATVLARELATTINRCIGELGYVPKIFADHASDLTFAAYMSNQGGGFLVALAELRAATENLLGLCGDIEDYINARTARLAQQDGGGIH